MKEEITYSKFLYRKVMKAKKMANLVLIVVTVVCFIILRVIYLQTPEIIAQNQLLVGAPVLVLVVSLIITTAQIFADKVKATYSGLVYHEGNLQYTYMSSNENRTYFKKFVIEAIDGIKEKKTHFVITGKIDCAEISVGHVTPRAVKSVRIPKYFEGLESILKEIKDASEESG